MHLTQKDWIASAQERLAMTGRGFRRPLSVIASVAKQSGTAAQQKDRIASARAPKNKQMSKALIKSSFLRASHAERLDCFGARAPRNDGVRSPPSSPHHCEPTGRANARPMTGSAKQSRSHENMRSSRPPGSAEGRCRTRTDMRASRWPDRSCRIVSSVSAATCRTSHPFAAHIFAPQ